MQKSITKLYLGFSNEIKVATIAINIIRSLSNGDGDGNEDRKKSNRIRLAKQQLCTCITLLYISLSSLYDYNVKVPDFTLYRGREHKRQRTSFSLKSRTTIQSFRIQLQKNLPTFDELNELE